MTNAKRTLRALIYARKDGSAGPWLVFVHGFACDHTDWRQQVDALSARYRCLSLDLRGHGRSSSVSAPFDMRTLGTDVVDVMRDNDVSAAVLVGHSMGTRVVAEALHAAPELVRGLVFVDGSRLGHGDPAEARATVASIIDNVGYEQVMRVNFAAMFNEDADAEVRQGVVERAAALPEPIGRALWAEMVTWDAAEMDARYAAIGVPLLVLQSSTIEVGGRRRSLEPGESNIPYLQMMTELVPHAQVELAPNVGHFIQLDEPDLVTRSVDALAQAAGV